MTVTRQQFLSLLEPKLRTVYNDEDFKRRGVIYTQYYGLVTNSKKATETVYEWTGVGDFSMKSEGGDVTFTDPISGNELAVSHVRRSNGYKITQEMLDHDQYAEIVKLEKSLQLSGLEDLEVTGHLLLNNAFGTTNVAARGFHAAGLDSLQLCSTAHTRLDGGANQSNRPSTDANLSWTSLADGLIKFQLWVDPRGRKIIDTPRKLVINPQDQLTAREVLGSQLKPGTANNELNALADFSIEVVVTPYLTSTNDWFLMGDSPKTFWYWDVQPRTSMTDDWSKEIIMRKRVHGSSNGHARWYGIYGTTGTT